MLEHELLEQQVDNLADAIFCSDIYFCSLSASWLFAFLGGHQNWRSDAVAEIEGLLDEYAPLSTFTDASSTSISLRLSSIPLEAWENEVPVLDAVIRETTRIAQPHVAMRRNLGSELYINNKIIPTDAYVVYPFSDVHLDPEIYPEPWRFDPGRREVDNVSFAYVGWGSGKRPFVLQTSMLIVLRFFLCS